LQQPDVAVGVAERRAGVVAATLGIQTADQSARPNVKELADFDSGGDQLAPDSLESETIRYALAEPGAADVRVLPNWTEHQEPGGVNWTTMGGVTSSLHPSFL
jgi:hypothetical protein